MNELINSYQDGVERCLRCGICLSVCPIYSEERHEGTVARGKVHLIRKLLEGKLQLTPRLRQYMDLCLGCQACVENCPSQVSTDKIVCAARAQFVKEKGLPLVYYLALRWGLKNPALMSALFTSLGLARNMALTKLLPRTLKDKEEILPPLPAQTFWQQYKKTKPSRRKVAYFVGCLTNLVYPQIGLATLRVLEVAGYEVIAPQAFCCGLPHYSSGDLETARELAGKNVALFDALDVDAILTDCGSCGSALKEYVRWLDNDSRARKFSEKIRDVSEFIVNTAGLKPGMRSLGRTVTYHDSCHLNRSMGVVKEPRAILRALPGVQYEEAVEANRCCGGAGTFNLRHGELSMKILGRKMDNVKATGADTIAVGCPSCRMQLSYGAKKNNVLVDVLHPVELLAMTFRGSDHE